MKKKIKKSTYKKLQYNYYKAGAQQENGQYITVSIEELEQFIVYSLQLGVEFVVPNAKFLIEEIKKQQGVTW